MAKVVEITCPCTCSQQELDRFVKQKGIEIPPQYFSLAPKSAWSSIIRGSLSKVFIKNNHFVWMVSNPTCEFYENEIDILINEIKYQISNGIFKNISEFLNDTKNLIIDPTKISVEIVKE